MRLFVQFSLQNRAVRTKKYAKNAHGAVGVVEAASSSLVTQTKKHRKRLFSVLFSCFFMGIAYFFAKTALFQNLTTTFLTTATRTFDHFCPKVASKNTIFECEETNLKFTGLRSIFSMSTALFLCFRHSDFSKFKRFKRFSMFSIAFLFPLAHLSLSRQKLSETPDLNLKPPMLLETRKHLYTA